MIDYPAGQAPDSFDPDPANDDYRFALGRLGKPPASTSPMIVIGMNPSHAREDQSDRTVNHVIETARRRGHDGWLMLNLYPERSPKPKCLSAYDPALSVANCDAIERVLIRTGATEVLAAWGNVPHKTLKRALVDVRALLDRMGVKVYTLDPLTALSNPRHPYPRSGPLPMLGPKVYIS